jgi:GNAT superfamily N-acetyltransferase
MNLDFQAPQPLLPTHRCDAFASSEPELDAWLTRRAYANQLGGASRTFVVVDAQQTVVGYYALAAGAVSHQIATPSARRNMPDPVPVMVLARLAVDQRAQGRKLGASLLQDAVKRCALVSQHAGIRALLVHALNDRAKQFYEHYGFQPSTIHPMTLLLRLQQS